MRWHVQGALAGEEGGVGVQGHLHRVIVPVPAQAVYPVPLHRLCQTLFPLRLLVPACSLRILRVFPGRPNLLISLLGMHTVCTHLTGLKLEIGTQSMSGLAFIRQSIATACMYEVGHQRAATIMPAEDGEERPYPALRASCRRRSSACH